MRRYVFLIIVILLSTSVLGFNNQNWPYYKDIILTNNINEPVRFELDHDILKNMKTDGSDIRILENDNEIGYNLTLKEGVDYTTQSSIIEVSSFREPYLGVSMGKENLIDGWDNSFYEIDPLVDKESAWFVVDLKQKRLTNTIKIWSIEEEYTWTTIEVEGSNDNKDWRLIKKPTDYSFNNMREVVYPNSDFRYLRFTLWHTQSLRIDEIEIYGVATGEVIFHADSSNEYKIYYGNPTAEKPNYDTTTLYTTATTPRAILSSQKNNINFDFDKDNDGISNQDDNCPLIKNSDQKNSDGDSLGDVCDNCIETSNQDQKDSDEDNVGDVCDNCPSMANKDQLDKDLNGIGYVCDDLDKDGVLNFEDNCLEIQNPKVYKYGEYIQIDSDRDGIGDACDEKDDRLFENNKPLLWVILIGAIIIVGFLAFRLSKKKL